MLKSSKNASNSSLGGHKRCALKKKTFVSLSDSALNMTIPSPASSKNDSTKGTNDDYDVRSITSEDNNNR